MHYKTIAVHVSDSRRAEALLEPVIDLAQRSEAHLIGMHVYAQVPAPMLPMPFAPAVLGSIVASTEANAAAVAATFSRLTAGATLTSEWQLLKVPHLDLASVVMERGRAADLIVAGQTDSNWDLAPLLDFPERLAIESGRPVLVIPHTGRHPKVGRNVVLAWKPTRESARAAFDALPLLAKAENVHVLEITEPRHEPAVARSAEIAASLARHGARVTVQTCTAPDANVGDEILAHVAKMRADLLVMGAYGHSRMREMVFGGATRFIARHMSVPTLFSH